MTVWIGSAEHHISRTDARIGRQSLSKGSGRPLARHQESLACEQSLCDIGWCCAADSPSSSSATFPPRSAIVSYHDNDAILSLPPLTLSCDKVTSANPSDPSKPTYPISFFRITSFHHYCIMIVPVPCLVIKTQLLPPPSLVFLPCLACTSHTHEAISSLFHSERSKASSSTLTMRGR